jgi:hypothetical protein
MIRQRRMRMAWHVVRMGEKDCAYEFRKENLKARDCYEYLGLYAMILFKWILKKEDESIWTGFIWLWIGTSGELL